MFRRDPPEEERSGRRVRPERSWSARLAWLVLIAGGCLVVARASLATVVRINGDGMAPTILHGDYVLLARGHWGITAGDIVVYDPRASAPPSPAPLAEPDHPQASGKAGQGPSRTQEPAEDSLPNAAVVNVEEIEANWARVQARTGQGEASGPPRVFRVGRVLAIPGDRVVFNAPDSALGLVVNGEPLEQKPSDPIRIRLAEVSPESSPHAQDLSGHASIRAQAYESLGNRRYPVLPTGEPTTLWPGLSIPAPDTGPAELVAEGYLVLADNRDAGACCDSRRLGWILAHKIRGEVILRLAGDPSRTPDLDPKARGMTWLP